MSAEQAKQHETQAADVKFLLSTIGEHPKKVLEVGCGCGRILVQLAKAGHDVTGFDVDDDGLNEISAKACGLNNISCHRADAVHDDWGIGFDVVVLAGNILFNIENIESGIEYKKAQELFIQKAAAALVPGGYVYIDYGPFAPNGRTLMRPGQSCEDDGSIYGRWEETDDAGNIEIRSMTPGVFDESTGILKFKRYLELRLLDGRIIKEESERVKHYATLEQIHSWLSDAGFTIKHEYEDYAKNPINSGSRAVIIYAQQKF